MALTAAEEQELAQLKGQVQPQQQKVGGLSPAEEQELAQLKSETGQTQLKAQPASNQGLSMDQFKGLLAKPFTAGGATPEADELVKQGVARALDYPAGLMRTGLASVGSVASGQYGKVGPNDVMSALKGQAPSSSEYMERLGVPEGPNANLPVLGHVSARGAAGLVSDVATDPSAAILGKLRDAGKLPEVIDKASTAASDLTNAAGESTYKSAFKKIDERLAEKNKGSLGDLLLENGAPTGSTKAISKQAGKMLEDSMTERSALYDKANELGASVDMGFPLKNTEEKLARIRDNPALKSMADNVEEKMITPFKNEGKVSLDRLSNWKSDLYSALPDSAFDATGKVKGPAKQIEKALSSDFRQAIIDSGNSAEAGLGDKIDQLNEKMGTLISAQKPTAMQVRREVTPNALTSVDAIMAGLGHAGALPIKKLADVSKTARFRTNLGKGLMNAAETGLPDTLLRRGLINQGR